MNEPLVPVKVFLWWIAVTVVSGLLGAMAAEVYLRFNP